MNEDLTCPLPDGHLFCIISVQWGSHLNASQYLYWYLEFSTSTNDNILV